MGANWVNSVLVAALFVIAWFIYQYQAPWQLYRRRAWLAHYTQSGGALRRLLWRQTFAMLLLSVQALIAALLLIVFASGLERLEWYVLWAALPFFFLIVISPPKILVREISPTLVALARLRVAVIVIGCPDIILAGSAGLPWQQYPFLVALRI